MVAMPVCPAVDTRSDSTIDMNDKDRIIVGCANTTPPSTRTQKRTGNKEERKVWSGRRQHKRGRGKGEEAYPSNG